MSKIDPETIQAVKDRIDVVELIRRYVDLRQAGERWMGVCPFHQETKPSMSVHPERGFFYCFGCHASGDVIDFYCRINGLEFMEGLQELAREAGVPLEFGHQEQAGEKARVRRHCLDMHALAQTQFVQALNGDQGQEARDYLHQRGFDPEVVHRFGLGWAPMSWNRLKGHLAAKGYSPEQGVQAGLLSKNQEGRIYDRFRSRLMFPIHNLSGKVVAFGGRIVGQGEPKYLNSSETPIYKKSDILYGLALTRQSVTQKKQALLTEGYADVLSLVQFGFDNACGVLGTALTSKQVRRLSGLCSNIALLFDGDRAGQEATLRSAQMILAAGLQVRVVRLPKDEDVDSLLRGHGADALQQLLQRAEEGLAFCLGVITSNAAPKDILAWAVTFLTSLKEVSWQAYYLPRLAEGLHLSEAELRNALRAEHGQRKGASSSRSTPSSPRGSGQRDRELLAYALRHPQAIPALDAQGLQNILRTERGRCFWQKVTRYGVDQVLPYLDEGEKAFFVSCQLEQEDQATAQRVWADITHLLAKGREQTTKESLKAAIAQAQARGETQEVARLLKAYSQFLKGAE